MFMCSASPDYLPTRNICPRRPCWVEVRCLAHIQRSSGTQCACAMQASFYRYYLHVTSDTLTFCTIQIGQVMLSLPRANYQTSPAAGLPLMIVRCCFLCIVILPVSLIAKQCVASLCLCGSLKVFI